MKGNYNMAKQGFLKLLDQVKKTDYTRQALVILRLLEDIAISEGRFDEARNYQQDFKKISQVYYEAEEEAEFHRSCGDLESATGHLDKACEAYEKALHLFTRLGMRKKVEWLEQKLQEIENLLMKSTSNQRGEESRA